MKRVIDPRALVRGFLLCLSSVALVGCNRSVEPNLIAFVAPRSGPDQAAGMRAGEAAALAIETANTDPAKHVGNRPTAILHGDSGEQPDGAGRQATRLIAINRVAAVIAGRNRLEWDRLVPVAEAQQIVMVAPCGGGTVAPSGLVYPVGLAPRERGRCLAKYLAEERKGKDVAVVVDSRSTFFLAAAAGFEQEFQHADRTVRSGYEIRTARDLEAVAASVAAVRPAALLYCGVAPDFLDFVRQLRMQNGWPESTILLFGGEDEATLVHGALNRVNGVLFTSAFHAHDKAQNVRDFSTRFRNRTGHEPDSDAALTYDAVNLLIETAKKADSFETKKLLPAFDKLEDTTCLTGPLWFTKDRQARRTIFVVETQDGTALLRRSYPPEKK